MKKNRRRLILVIISLCICGAIAVFDLITRNDMILFTNQLVILIGITICIILVKEECHYRILDFFSMWVMLYNIVYFILFQNEIVDLYKGTIRIGLQLIVPFLYAVIVVSIENQKKREEQKYVNK